MADSVEYMFRDALRKYSCYEGKKNVYGVCWYAYLLDKFGCENEANVITEDKSIYRIIASDRPEAVRIFLSKKYDSAHYSSRSDYKEQCVRMIVESTYKYGKMHCLENNAALRDFSIDVETVIDGEYYSVDEENDADDNARIKAIIKNVDMDGVIGLITPQLFMNVYIEAHLYDVAGNRD